MAVRILVIEDSVEIARLVKEHLEAAGYSVTMAHDGNAGLAEVERNQYTLVILDLTLPGIDGIELCRLIRTRKLYIPVLMLTSRDDVVDRVVGLELGADDYVTKPFSFRELVARVRAIVRLMDNLGSREETSAEEVIRAGNLRVDMVKRSVFRGDRRIELTSREFAILSLMARHPGKAFSRAQILREVWGYTSDCYAHAVDSHINRIRAKIEENPAKPCLVLTVWGVGYRLDDREAGVDCNSPAHSPTLAGEAETVS